MYVISYVDTLVQSGIMYMMCIPSVLSDQNTSNLEFGMVDATTQPFQLSR